MLQHVIEISFHIAKILLSYGLRNVYILILKVGSFSLLFTCCRVLVMAAMLVVNGFVRLARDDCMTEQRSMKNHAKNGNREVSELDMIHRLMTDVPIDLIAITHIKCFLQR